MLITQKVQVTLDFEEDAIFILDTLIIQTHSGIYDIHDAIKVYTEEGCISSSPVGSLEIFFYER
ncbi:hypothetical protein M1M88_02020 [Peptococcaceae bacterium]|nr:hypothetical protein [Peptococcaceae bacterium]